MEISFTKNTLKKLESILEELSFDVRYEKGHFNSGFCIVLKKKIILISKFFDTRARIESMLDIIGEIEIQEQVLTEKSQKFLNSLSKVKMAA